MKQFGHSQRVSRVVMLSMAAALALGIIASLLYAGGSAVDKTAAHYSWSYNFFSDLGITKTYLDKSNLIGMVAADAALVLAGVGIVLFAGLKSVFTAQRHKTRNLADNSVILAVFAGVGMAALALLPWNLHLELHLNLVKIVFTFAALYALCLLIVQWANRWPLIWRLMTLAYLCATAGFLAVVLRGPALDTVRGIEIQSAAQKAVFYLTFIYFGLQSYAVRRHLRRSSNTTE